jgi:hypothetical protein
MTQDQEVTQFEELHSELTPSFFIVFPILYG